MTSGESFERGALLGASRRFAGPLLVAVALFFRLPLLLQPFFTSDAAITGLQGLHMLRGEFSRWLWERPYQSSLEPAIAAVFEKLLGANLLAIAAGPVLEELLVCWLLHRLLSRYVGDWPAAIACLPVALPVMPLIAPVIFGTRALVGLVAIAAVVLADRAESIAGFSLAAAALVFCLFLDLYALQLVPPLLLLIVLPAHKRGRLAAVIAGAAAAAAAVAALRIGADSSILGQGLHLPFNAKLALLFRVCLPVALGSYWHRLDATAMNGGGLPGEGLRILGAVALLAGIASGALLWFRRSLPLAVRRMGLCGALAAAGSVAAFLVSGLSQDLWSSRYLVAALWAAPLALAPAAHLLGAGRLLLGLIPWLASATIAACVALEIPASLRPGPLDGLSPDEVALRDFLRNRGVRAGTAQYWVSYRLTYLFGERPIIVPINQEEDRYPPYRDLFRSAGRLAYVFHPSQSSVRIGPVRQMLEGSGKHIVEEARFGPYTALVVER